MTQKYNEQHRFLWSHGIDMLQDAAIQTAIDQWYRDTGALIDKFKMLKIIIMKYGANAGAINKIIIQQGEMFFKTEQKPKTAKVKPMKTGFENIDFDNL